MTDFATFTAEDFLANESFSNYLLGKNGRDIQFWDNWIKENPISDNEINKARFLFFLLKNQPDSSSKNDQIERQYNQLHLLIRENVANKEAKVISLPSIGEKSIENPLNRRMVWKVSGVAAILFISVSLLVYFSHSVYFTPKTTFSLFAKTGNFTKEIILPDKSIVQLNSNSSLEISKNFNQSERKIILKGSAFFKVYKDPTRPFMVITGAVKTTAIGTEFYIYNLHPEPLSVSLLKGKVRVEGEQNQVELLPGEKAFYDFGKLIKKPFNKEQLLNFSSGKIQFDHSNLQNIKTILEEYFNKEVLLEGEPEKLNFTGDFDSKKIESILQALAFTYNITYKLSGLKVIISFNK